jgi:hypothetical protein
MPPTRKRSISAPSGERSLSKEHLQTLLDVLEARGYRVIGPTISQEAIVYDEIHSADQLPRGWTDEQSGGR